MENHTPPHQTIDQKFEAPPPGQRGREVVLIGAASFIAGRLLLGRKAGLIAGVIGAGSTLLRARSAAPVAQKPALAPVSTPAAELLSAPALIADSPVEAPGLAHRANAPNRLASVFKKWMEERLVTELPPEPDPVADVREVPPPPDRTISYDAPAPFSIWARNGVSVFPDLPALAIRYAAPAPFSIWAGNGVSVFPDLPVPVIRYAAPAPFSIWAGNGVSVFPDLPAPAIRYAAPAPFSIWAGNGVSVFPDLPAPVIRYAAPAPFSIWTEEGVGLLPETEAGLAKIAADNFDNSTVLENPVEPAPLLRLTSDSRPFSLWTTAGFLATPAISERRAKPLIQIPAAASFTLWSRPYLDNPAPSPLMAEAPPSGGNPFFKPAQAPAEESSLSDFLTRITSKSVSIPPQPRGLNRTSPPYQSKREENVELSPEEIWERAKEESKAAPASNRKEPEPPPQTNHRAEITESEIPPKTSKSMWESIAATNANKKASSRSPSTETTSLLAQLLLTQQETNTRPLSQPTEAVLPAPNQAARSIELPQPRRKSARRAAPFWALLVGTSIGVGIAYWDEMGKGLNKFFSKSAQQPAVQLNEVALPASKVIPPEPPPTPPQESPVDPPEPPPDTDTPTVSEEREEREATPFAEPAKPPIPPVEATTENAKAPAPEVEQPVIAAPKEPEVPEQIPSDPEELERYKARQAVRTALTATTFEKVRSVISAPEKVEPLASSYYSRPGLEPFVYSEITHESSTKVPRTGKLSFLLQARSADRPAGFPVYVEQTDDGYKIDWEMFTQCKDRALAAFASDLSSTEGSFFTRTKRSHYWKKDMPNLKKYDCFELLSPNPDDEPVHAFVAKDTDFATQVASRWEWGTVNFTILKLKRVPHEGGTHIEIDKLIQTSWHK